MRACVRACVRVCVCVISCNALPGHSECRCRHRPTATAYAVVCIVDVRLVGDIALNPNYTHTHIIYIYIYILGCFTKSNHAICLIHMDARVPFTYLSTLAKNYNFSTTIGGPAKALLFPKTTTFSLFQFLLTVSSYCVCSSFVVRAVLNFSMNAMARSAE